MALVDKEKLKNYAMQKSMVMMQNPRVMNAAMKAIEMRGKLNDRVDNTVNKVAESLKLVVKEDITKTNHALKDIGHNIKDLSETIETLQKQLKKSEAKIKKLEKQNK